MNTPNDFPRNTVDLYGHDNREMQLDAETEARIKSLLADAVNIAPEHFACLREFDSTRLTQTQRSSLTALSEIARKIGERTGDQSWGKLARLLFRATHSFSTK
jgi:hypothetical protein